MASIHCYEEIQGRYGVLPIFAGFHPILREAGIRRIQERITGLRISKQHRYFLQIVVEVAIRKSNCHTILLESFGVPVLTIANWAYTLQSAEDQEVYVVRLEEVYAKQKKEWNPLWIVGFCLGLGVLTFFAKPPFPQILSHPFTAFYA